MGSVEKKIDFYQYLWQMNAIGDREYSIIRERQLSDDEISTRIKTAANLITIYRQQWDALEQADLNRHFSDDLLDKLSTTTCQRFKIIPYDLDKSGKLKVACVNPLLNAMRKVVSREIPAFKIEYCLADKETVLRLLKVYYRDISHIIDKAQEASGESAFLSGDSAGLDTLIDQIVIDGYERHATDIHLVFQGDILFYRLRLNNCFFPMIKLPNPISMVLKNRLLIRSGCAFNRLNNVRDAAVEIPYKDTCIPVRVSYVPTPDGYSIVLRIIRPSYLSFNKDDFLPEQWSDFIFQMKYNRGLVLITGPVGSGKTTIYYSSMQYLASERMKIISLEDPVESNVHGAFQVDLGKTRLTFSDTMKVILRQDPDIVMIGEVRTEEEIKSVSAAKLSGNMVFTTLHALTPWDTLIKLRRLGYPEEQLLNQSVTILTVRLVPIICSDCAEVYQPTAEEMRQLEVLNLQSDVKSFKKAVGCEVCQYSGYVAMKPFYDVLTVDASHMTKLMDNWNSLRQDSHLHGPINHMRSFLMGLMKKGDIDLKTLFGFLIE
ncbi:MAG: hypothetical protein CMF46_00300 [Legionellales bacterium]|nr:hypothetical protein [Legionellales bacterium]|tara:strand:+ start:704 stop:2341 length:1638 start_codon:yes stop_codon:yes gene_type:complete